MSHVKESDLVKYLEKHPELNDVSEDCHCSIFRAIELDSGLWEIGLSNNQRDKVCKISTKRSPNDARLFSTLNGVEKFFKKIGVTKFMVVMLKKH
jgi:hypothetical protein